MEVYHYSNEKFNKFDFELSNDIFKGMHFGSIEQAIHAKEYYLEEGIGDGVLMKCEIEVKNPLYFGRNIGRGKMYGPIARPSNWGRGSVLRAIFEEKITNFPVTEELIELYNTDGLCTKSGKSLLFDDDDGIMQEFLRDFGFDSVSYDNSEEGGGKAYIVFKPSQIKRIEHVKM